MAIRSAPILAQLSASDVAPAWTGEVPEPTEATLGLQYVEQENAFWCWAACVEMIGMRLGVDPPLQRCELASRVVADGTPCCQPPYDRMYPCNQAADDGQIERAYAELGLAAEPYEGPIPQDVLWRELASSRAVQIGYGYIGTQDGHVLLIGGYRHDGNELRFDVLDPSGIEGPRSLLYEELNPYSYGNAVWTRTWLITMTL